VQIAQHSWSSVVLDITCRHPGDRSDVRPRLICICDPCIGRFDAKRGCQRDEMVLLFYQESNGRERKERPNSKCEFV
jgi:hypothetical protein